MTNQEFFIQPATVNDVDVIARHRAEMFRDMGRLPDELYEPMKDATRLYFARAMDEGEYVGFLATAASDPDKFVGGAGIQFRPALPGITHSSDDRRLTAG